jgi:AAA15 family ATPase/GTPase
MSKVRLLEIKMRNFKNVKFGEIEMLSFLDQEYMSEMADILGIYGPNASGKTAVIDALAIIKGLFTNNAVKDYVNEFIHVEEDFASIDVKFALCDLGEIIRYSVKFAKNNGEFIKKEKLVLVELDNDSETELISIDDSSSHGFSPVKSYEALINSSDKIDIEVAKRIAAKEGRSFIFSIELKQLLLECQSLSFLRSIISTLYTYAETKLFIIDTHKVDSLDLIIEDQINNGACQIKQAIPLNKPFIVSSDRLSFLEKKLEQLNIVLSKVLYGLKLGIKDFGEELNQTGESTRKVELLAIRENIVLPLRVESHGTKKFIAIINALISFYNYADVCVVIDELDSGIFEFLLGELLEIFSQRAKGQLIFTSHNLRPLEKIDNNFIVFTTTNENNRFIRLSSINQNQNLRSEYFRGIALDNQSEKLYIKANSYDIARAFRNAGKEVDRNE